MKTSLYAVCVLIAGGWMSVLAWASGHGVGGQYVPHGPVASAEFEGALYNLNPVFARGVWPAQEILNTGVAKDDIPQPQRAALATYIRRVLSKSLAPTANATLRGVRHIYDNKDALLLKERIDQDISIEVTSTTSTLTVAFESPVKFNQAPAGVTKQALLGELGTLFNIPQEQLVKGEIDIVTVDVAGRTVVKGIAHIPSPAEAGEGLKGFRWYNKIVFWRSQGKFFASVVPFEGAVAQPVVITLDRG